MKRKPTTKPISNRFPLLYAYATLTFLLNSTGLIFTNTSVNKLYQTGTYFSPQALHQIALFGSVFGLIFNTAILLYLLFSKNFRGVFLLLKIMLAFSLLALIDTPILLLNKHIGYNEYFKIFIVLSVVTQTILLIKLVRQVSKKKEIELARAVENHKSKLLRAEPKNYVPPKPILLPYGFTKVLKVILRLIVGSWALALIYIGILVSFGPHAHLLTLGLPLIILGILFLTPFYILNRPLTVGYTAALIYFTILVVYLLHLPVEQGLPSFASLPLPTLQVLPGQTFNITALYAFAIFHSIGFLIPASLLFVLDSISGLIKYAEIPENTKRSIKVVFISIVFLSIFVLIGIAQSNTSNTSQPVPVKASQCTFRTLHIGEVNFTYCTPKNNAVEQLVDKNSIPFIETDNLSPKQLNFNSATYDFAIDFPNKPTSQTNSSPPDCGNNTISITSFNSSFGNGSEIYTIYATEWPKQDTVFANMSLPALKATLINFISDDMTTNNATASKIHAEYLLPSKSLTEEAQFTRPGDGYNPSGYIRIFTIGNFEYDIMYQGPNEQSFEDFADSFTFTGPKTTIPDDGSGISNSSCVAQNVNPGPSGVPTTISVPNGPSPTPFGSATYSGSDTGNQNPYPNLPNGPIKVE